MVVGLLKKLYRNVLHKLVLLKDRREFMLLELLLERPEFIPLIMSQEIYAVDSECMCVNTTSGRRIVFELKSDPSEFDREYHDALSKYLSSPHLASAK